jgi:hypothetical protein
VLGFFATEQFNFEFQLALGHVWYGCGDVGELFSTADRIGDGDADRWCDEWVATAERVEAIADGCVAGGHAGMRDATPQERQNMAWRAKPYGKHSTFEVFAAARKYTLDGLADRIKTPLLITDPDGEQFWPGQLKRLHDAVPAPKRLVAFAAAEGADRHCEPMARSLVEQRIFDWLDETLAVNALDR